MNRRNFLTIGSKILLPTALLPAPFIQAQIQNNAFTSTPPTFPLGFSSGDVTAQGAVIWSKTDQPALMRVEVSLSADFSNPSRFDGDSALAEQDYNAKTMLHGLAAGQRWFYRVIFESLQQPGVLGISETGQFKTAPTTAVPIRFCWSGDTAGQGYGIDPAQGGMQTYRAMLQQQPDFMVHCGDLIYADGPILPKHPQSTVPWNNLIPAPYRSITQVAQQLADFRCRYYYNFLDPQVRAFHQQVPVYQQWDDHEVINNWYPGQQLTDDRYQEKSVSLLAERARAAFFQCNPIRQQPNDSRQIYRHFSYGPLLELFIIDKRSYRGPNSLNRQSSESAETDYLGPAQLEWLQRALKASTATWKIIASDMPIGLRVTNKNSEIAENMANGDGAPAGRELEFCRLLRFIQQQQIRNVHFITADVHYAASHYYQPERAVFKDFQPFWEFVSGPLHAGTFGPSQLDNTFGPEVRFVGIPADMPQNSPPSAGFQFFGQMDIDPVSQVLTVSHRNRQGQLLWQHQLQPES